MAGWWLRVLCAYAFLHATKTCGNYIAADPAVLDVPSERNKLTEASFDHSIRELVGLTRES